MREGRGPQPLDLAPRPSFVGWRELSPACPSLSSSGDTCEATYEICINLSPTAHTRGTSALREQNQGLEKAPMAFSSDFPLEKGLLAHGQTQIDRGGAQFQTFKKCAQLLCLPDTTASSEVDPTSVFVALTLSLSQIAVISGNSLDGKAGSSCWWDTADRRGAILNLTSSRCPVPASLLVLYTGFSTGTRMRRA